MTESERWKKIFTEKMPCDFCDDDHASIMRATVHPAYRVKDAEMVFTGVIFSYKCTRCCEEQGN
jgi:hypothetical protein